MQLKNSKKSGGAEGGPAKISPPSHANAADVEDLDDTMDQDRPEKEDLELQREQLEVASRQGARRREVVIEVVNEDEVAEDQEV